MTKDLSYTNFEKRNKNNKNPNPPSFLNRLKINKTGDASNSTHKKSFENKFFKNYEYNIPQFYINNTDNIKGFFTIDTYYKIYQEKYDYLKQIIESNKQFLKIPTKNLNLNLSEDNNLIFKNLSFQKAIDYEYLIKNKEIFKNLREYQGNNYLYKSITSSLFIKIINETLLPKEKKIFLKLYKDFSKIQKTILKYNYSMGIMGYKDIFKTYEDPDNELKHKKNKYVLYTHQVLNNNSTTTNINNNTNRLEDALLNYTELYNPYNYSKTIINIKKKISNDLIKLHNLTKTLSNGQFTNVYDLLNLVLDQEYYLINFSLYFNDIEKYKKILQQDIKIRKYIKRNLIHFSSFKDDYMQPSSTNNITENLFSIPSYNPNQFFNNTTT